MALKIYVTGSTGFIGRAFCAFARARGHEVLGLERPHRLNAPPWDEIRRFAPDVCVHAAWIATPGAYLNSPLNADFLRWSLAFVKGMRELGTRHFVVLGTCIEYAPSERKLSEETSTLGPLSLYGSSKNALRMALENDARAGDISLAWARVFYAYGSGEHPDRLSSSLVRQLRQNKQCVLRTPDSIKDYIHVDDVASALLAVVKSRFSGAINIGTGEGVRIREIAHTLALLVNKPGLVCDASPVEPDEYPYVVAEVSKLMRLGWQPQVDLATGLKKLVDSLP